MRYDPELLTLAEDLWTVMRTMARRAEEKIYQKGWVLADDALTQILSVLTNGEADDLLNEVMSENAHESIAYCLGLWAGKKEAEEFKRKYESIITG